MKVEDVMEKDISELRVRQGVSLLSCHLRNGSLVSLEKMIIILIPTQTV